MTLNNLTCCSKLLFQLLKLLSSLTPSLFPFFFPFLPFLLNSFHSKLILSFLIHYLLTGIIRNIPSIKKEYISNIFIVLHNCYSYDNELHCSYRRNTSNCIDLEFPLPIVIILFKSRGQPLLC